MDPSPLHNRDPKAKSIAVIDDLEDLAVTLVMLLEADGYHAEYALTGAAGIELVSRMGADAVLLDYVLPDMTGSAVGNALRSNSATSAVKVLMCTSTPEDKVRADFTSYHSFLPKPVAHRDLVQALDAALNSP